MDEDDRDSNASSDNEQDEVMEDVDEPENENDNDNNEPEEEDNDDDQEDDDDDDKDDKDDQNDDQDNDQDAEEDQEQPASQTNDRGGDDGDDGDDGDGDGDGDDGDDGGDGPRPTVTRTSATPTRASATPGPSLAWRPAVRPEALTAKLYDIVPTMAAPQATSINAISVTPDLRYWMTGGSDGYVRKYDGVGTINGKQLLTVAQRHPFVDSVTKAGVLMSYWENEEPTAPGARSEDKVLSPVYSLAVHSQALWLLSGTEGGGINLQSVRHDEGKRITCLHKHSNAVSVLQLAPDEKSVLSGSWDKSIYDWDLNNGQVKRQFDGNGSQVSALELRPSSGAPIPQAAYEEPISMSDTISTNNAKPLTNGTAVDGIGHEDDNLFGPSDITIEGARGDHDGNADAEGSSAHESLFGSPGGSLFGENDAVGENPFGDDNDNDNANDFGASMDMSSLQPDAAGDEGSGANTTSGGDVDMSGMDHAAGTEQPPPAALEDETDSSAAAGHSDSAYNSNTAVEDETGDTSDANNNSNKDLVSGQHGQQDGESAEAEGTNEIEDEPDSQREQQPPSSPIILTSQPGPSHFDPTQASDTTFLSASIDGTIRIWDRRVPDPVARIGNRPGVPPWCMGVCWSPDGNWIYAGRRNGTVEEFSIHRAASGGGGGGGGGGGAGWGWSPERTLKFPGGSGAVSSVRAMVNGRHLVCASHDILRLYDLRDTAAVRGSSVPFLIIPGPPRAGVISQLYIDPSSRYMISAAGTRGWEGTCTEVLIGYEIGTVS